jgi:hypothetical protein
MAILSINRNSRSNHACASPVQEWRQPAYTRRKPAPAHLPAREIED